MATLGLAARCREKIGGGPGLRELFLHAVRASAEDYQGDARVKQLFIPVCKEARHAWVNLDIPVRCSPMSVTSERRLRSLEQQLERVGDRTSGSTAEIAERVGAGHCSGVEQHRRSVSWRRAYSMGDEAAKLGNDVPAPSVQRDRASAARHTPSCSWCGYPCGPGHRFCCRRFPNGQMTARPRSCAMTSRHLKIHFVGLIRAGKGTGFHSKRLK